MPIITTRKRMFSSLSVLIVAVALGVFQAPAAAASDSYGYTRLDTDASRKVPALGTKTQPDPPAAQPDAVTLAATVGVPFNGLNQTAPSASAVSDTILAASSSTTLQATNSSLRLTNQVGTQLSNMTLSQFFSAPAGDGTLIDPKVYFDRNAVNQRYYVVALQNTDSGTPFNASDDLSTIHLAISRSSSPSSLAAAGWCRYLIDGLFVDPVTTQNEVTHSDFPSIGFGADAFVITTRQHGPLVFGVTIIRALNKLIYSNNALGTCPLDAYWELQASPTFNDFTAFTLQAAQHYTNPSSFPGTSNPVYLVSTRHGGSFSSYRVWRVSNMLDVSPPKVESVTVAWSTYSEPPDAPGGAGGTKVDTGIAEILQTAGVGNAISAVHTLACQFTANTALESCWRMVRFIVGQTNGVMTVTKSELQGLGGGDNAFYHHPGLAVNNSNETAVVFLAQLPGNAHRISSRVATKSLGAGFGVSSPLANGTCARAPFLPGQAVRSGDYVGAQTAVDGDSFWISAEHAEVLSGTCRWATKIAKVTHP